MATIAELLIRFGVDTRDVKRDADKAAPAARRSGQKAGREYSSGFRTAARAIKGILAAAVAAASIGAIAHGIGNVITTASDLNETVSKTQVIFGNAANDVIAFANKADMALGQSTRAALDGASTFAIYGKGAGLAGKHLVKFSTGLVSLASDMASFSNTRPEEAIQAIGAAMRGESDPIEKYGVLLNEAVLKQRAFSMGLVATTSKALTPQQRVLAVQAELYAQLGKQGSKTMGDFARTSHGLANQQRILSAQWTNMKATIGQALLPVATAFVTVLTGKLMPALQQMWAEHGPKVVDWGMRAAAAFSAFADRLAGLDFAAIGTDAMTVLRELGPALQGVKDAGPAFADTLKVGAVLLKVAAENADLLAKALPFLAAGYLVVKTAQIGANIAATASPAIRLAEVAANLKLAASQRALTASMVTTTTVQRASTTATIAGTAAENAATVSKTRGVAATVASRAAMLATATATGIWTAAQWLLNVALTANPIGLIIVGIAALIAIIVLIATKTTWFQDAWNAAWGWIKKTAADFWGWIKGTLWPGLKKTFFDIAMIFTWPTRTAINAFGKLVGWLQGFGGKVRAALGNVPAILSAPFRIAFNKISSLWNGTAGRLSFTAPGWVPGIGGKGFSMPKLPMLQMGGLIREGGSAIVADRHGRGGEVVSMPAGARVDPLPRGGDRPIIIELHGEVKKFIRATVRNSGGRGSVQNTFGRRVAAA